jgi:multisubunit Na+/H+ antiporter MnhC subunit
MMKVNWNQILIGLVFLLFGMLVYLIDRPPEQTYFLNNYFKLSLHNYLPPLFGNFASNLPAFVHVFSFILITSGLVARKKQDYIIICVGWSVIDSTFELGQRFDAGISTIIPAWFANVPFLENTRNYFVQGTFDVIDLTAIAIGTALAFITLQITFNREEFYYEAEI